MSPCGERGFSYVEVLLSMILLAVLLVPALESLQTGIIGSQAAAITTQQLALRDKMERVAARPFYDLYAMTYQPGGNNAGINAALSDPAGTPNRRAVALYRYDPAAATLTNNDTGVVAISVYYESQPGIALNTLVGRWW